MANIFIEEFLDDMVDVGLRRWAELLLPVLILTYAFSRIPGYSWLVWAGIILTLNLAGALLMTAYHKYYRRPRRAW
ncbi:MAG: hypothetical protein ABEI52_04900, partial [Halobacteriaceae archaeon]